MDPKVFTEALQKTVAADPPRFGGDDRPAWTRWFERQMQAIAKAEGLHCQNKLATSHYKEVMAIDHVLSRSVAYDSFPLIAVEHENGPLGSRDGSLPVVGTGEYIEWALWKVLAMRAHLAVAVVYPYKDNSAEFHKVVGMMLRGWEEDYGSLPSLLILAGWWRRPDRNGPADPPTLYEALVAGSGGKLERIGTIVG